MAIPYSMETSVPFQAYPPDQPFREHCQVNFAAVQTIFNGTADTFACIYEPRKERVHDDAPSSNARLANFSNDKSHLQEVTQGLYMASADDDSELDKICATYNRFSHIVQVTSDHHVTSDIEEEVHPITGTRKLRLSCQTYDSDDIHTVVRVPQLLAARNFVSSALPFGKASSPNMSCLNCDVNLLVVAPTGRRVDVMSIIICYLAFISTNHTNHVLDIIDAFGQFDQAWKGDIFNQRGVEFVEYVARLV